MCCRIKVLTSSFHIDLNTLLRLVYCQQKKGVIKIPNYTAFSKKNVLYARLEAYIFSLILIVMVSLDKDVSAIAVLLSLAWAGYKGLQCFYIWMCKHEHLMDKKIEYKKLGLNTDRLNAEMEELECEDPESEDY